MATCLILYAAGPGVTVLLSFLTCSFDKKRKAWTSRVEVPNLIDSLLGFLLLT